MGGGRGATYKVEEAASDFVAGVRLGLQQLLHHGQEVPVDGEDLLDVGEQDLEVRAGTLRLTAHGSSYMWFLTCTKLAVYIDTINKIQ